MKRSRGSVSKREDDMGENENKEQEEKMTEEKKPEEKKPEEKKPESENPPVNEPKTVGNGYKIAIIVLAVLVTLLVAFIVTDKLGGGSDKDGSKEVSATTEAVTEKKTDDATSEVTEAKTEAETEAKSEAKTEAGSEEGGKAGETVTKRAISATVKVAASWPVDKGFVVQYSVDVKNGSASAIKDWEVRIPGFKDAKVDQGWNAEFKIKGDDLLCTPVDYDRNIEPKTSINYGVQVIFKSEAESKTAKTDAAAVFLDGKEATETIEVPVAAKVEKKKVTEPENGTPLEVHGALSVKGVDLVDKNGKEYQLKGVSTHGLAWFPDYVNLESFRTFRDDWGANLIRLAMYTGEGGGYCTDGDKDKLKKLIDSGVDYASQLGMYVIIDWHILSDSNPQDNKEEALAFFEEMSSKYADYNNVLYEICNEPNGGTTWEDIKAYAEEVIPVIRKNAPKSIIIVGTPTWSQDVDIAAKDPITGQENIMYTLHFYAATHKENLRDKLKTAREAGLPIFISEFSICDASGNGGIDYDSADAWFQMINDYNLSYAGWNISNKNESSALIKPDCSKTSGWKEDDLSETGLWLRNTMK